MTDRLDQLGPIDLADQAQCGDDVADRQIGIHLRRLAIANQRQCVGAMLLRPATQRRNGFATLDRHSLPQLRQVTASQPEPLHGGMDVVQITNAEVFCLVPGGMRHFARNLVARNAVGHAAQVFQQHDAKRGRKSPQLAQSQFIDFLVGVEKGGEEHWVQHAVGVSHVSPGDAVDTRQALQRLFGQLRQVCVIAVRHALLNLLKLRFDQVEVVQ